MAGSSFSRNYRRPVGRRPGQRRQRHDGERLDLRDNISANIGGGLETSGAGSLTLTNSTVSANHATTDGGGLYWTPGVAPARLRS